MIYPKFIKKNNTIGVTALSDGITNKAKLNRLNSAINQLKNKGFNIKETKNVRKSSKGKSSSSKIQAKELLSLYQNTDVSAIICASGGEFACEVLPYLDLKIIKENPKWIQGYSDPTNLLYIITTNLDIATIYSDNFTSFGMIPWHKSLHNNLNILQGNIKKQTNFDKYESIYQEYLTGTEPYYLTEPVKWYNLNNNQNIIIKGRIIGGCLDCLNDIFGTRFDNTKNFIEKYKEDGIIWYFDNCELSNEQLIRTLHKFKDNGWFKHTKGIIFGRNGYKGTSPYNISFEESINHILKDLNIPIIINTDIGHIPPRITIINGSIATIISNKEECSITFELK